MYQIKQGITTFESKRQNESQNFDIWNLYSEMNIRDSVGVAYEQYVIKRVG